MALVKYNNQSLSSVTAVESLPSGGMTLIKTVTASSDGNISFVHGTSDVVLDGTYPIYLFKFINLHASSGSKFTVNFRDGGSSYDATKTTTHFGAYHNEAGTGQALGYEDGRDHAQVTGYANLSDDTNTDADHGVVGWMYLFNPSSTTYVKHFMARTRVNATWSTEGFVAGYANVTAAVDGVDFKFGSGNIDSGTIKLYGIKDS